MSDFLDNLNTRKRNLQQSSFDVAAQRRDFCEQRLDRLAYDAVDTIKQEFAERTAKEERDGKYVLSSEDRDNFDVVQYGGDNHAAWKVGSVPQSIIGMPGRLEIEDYSIYLLDDGSIISVTSFYDDRPAHMEPYDPSRYETSEYNVISIYYNIAALPGNMKFYDDNLKGLPGHPVKKKPGEED